MATFFLGQRVRIIQAVTPHGRSFIGRQATITEVMGLGSNRFYGLDISPMAKISDDYYAWMGWQLEPIQYDGMQPVAWSECLWQPEGVAA